MRVFHNFSRTSGIRRPVVTIGSYDGVHLGHRTILARIGALAAIRGGESVVVTFDPHPRAVLGGLPMELLSTLPEKLELLEEAGVDNVVVVDFTREFSRISPRDFVRNDLVGRLGMDTLLVGYNHRLGRDKEGDRDFLLALGRELGFTLEVMPRQDVDEHKVSSTVIRQLIASGQMAGAACFLGAPYPLSGRLTVGGKVRGLDAHKLLPPPGNYCVGVACPGFSNEPLPARLKVSAGRSLSLSGCGVLPAGSDIVVKFEGKEG